MAVMLPSAVERFHSEGEERVYRWLQAVARPDSAYLAWYTPDVGDRQPDFLLYAEGLGLVILEVKDWTVDQLVRADPHWFDLALRGKTIRRPNPLRQAREYADRLRDLLVKDGRLLSDDPLHKGKLKIPLAHGVVLSNVLRDEWEERGWARILPSQYVFFADDVHPASALSVDASGHAFRATLEERFPPLFPCTITAKEVYYLKGVLFPEVRVNLPPRGDVPKHEEASARLRVLDHNHEAIARKWDGGHRLIVGPSGSGKTLVLVHRAALLKRYDPRVRRMLFLCFNITLVNYLRRLLASKRVPLGETGVEVLHIYELCQKLRGEEVIYEGQDKDYYELVVEEALDRARSSDLRYDAILVDEGQDFSDEMLALVTTLLNCATDHLTIALDEAQDLYRPRASWKERGAKAVGRVHRLKAVYRNTREIKALADRFAATPAGLESRSVTGADEPGEHGQLELLPELLAEHGPAPVIRRRDDFNSVVASLPSLILELEQSTGCPLSEVAVLYPSRLPLGAAQINIPLAVGQALDGAGISWRWASEDYRAKRSYDITAESVTVTTIHSAKGLDLACAIVLGLDLLKPGERWDEDELRSLTYVALTRARRYLYVLWCSRNSIMERMLA